MILPSSFDHYHYYMTFEGVKPALQATLLLGCILLCYATQLHRHGSGLLANNDVCALVNWILGQMVMLVFDDDDDWWWWWWWRCWWGESWQGNNDPHGYCGPSEGSLQLHPSTIFRLGMVGKDFGKTEAKLPKAASCQDDNDGNLR